MFYLKGKKMSSEKEFTRKYNDIETVIDGCQIQEIVQLLAYILAEIAFENAAPKRDFISFFVECFDNAYQHQINSAKEQKGH